MKKAQILSAIALAFALGVTPVIATANTVSAFTVADDEHNGKASCGEVNDVVAGVKADSKIYVGESTLFALNEKYSKIDNNADVDGTEASTIEGLAETVVNGTSMTFTKVAGLPTTNATIAQLQEVLDNVNNISETFTNQVSNQTRKIYDYKIWSGIFKGIEAKKDGKGDTALKDALTYAFSQTGITDFDWATKKDISNYDDLNTNPLTSRLEYKNFLNLYKEVKDVNKILARRETAIGEYKAAFVNYGSYILTDSGNDQYKTILSNEGTDKPGIQVKDFMYLVGNGGGDWIKNRSAWYSVYTEVKEAGDGACNQSNTEYENYEHITDIAGAYRTATWDRFAGKDIDEVAVYLMNLGKKNPDAGANKPGDTNKPDANDPTAPDTGIIADAEGNASTTVAMVAGVATALTAAGAGVVAYRNARRSTRK